MVGHVENSGPNSFQKKNSLGTFCLYCAISLASTIFDWHIFVSPRTTIYTLSCFRWLPLLGVVFGEYIELSLGSIIRDASLYIWLYVTHGERRLGIFFPVLSGSSHRKTASTLL